jgi:hypothetical protein
MAHIKTITLTLVLMASSTGIARADEVEFITPDISGNLNVMVEKKMESNANNIRVDNRDMRIVEQLIIELNNLQRVKKSSTQNRITEKRT